MAGITSVGQVSATSAATQVYAAGFVIQDQGCVTLFSGEQQITASSGHGRYAPASKLFGRRKPPDVVEVEPARDLTGGSVAVKRCEQHSPSG